MKKLAPEEAKEYTDFVIGQANALKLIQVNPEEVVWHYTTGNALISIIETGTL
jgi:hypothetical protein